jgi:hypothetical protein
MKVVGLMTARNEDWILGLTLRGAMLIVDEMIVHDHSSTDRTQDIIDEVSHEYPGRVRCLRGDHAVWHEASIREHLLEEGRKVGATHFWVVDADELLTGNLLLRIRPMLASLEAGDFLDLPWFAIWRSLDLRRQDNSYWCGNRTAFGFRDHPAIHYRARTSTPGYDIHVREPALPGTRRVFCSTDAEGGVMHFATAGWARLVAKSAWYKMMETVRFAHRTPEKLNAIYDRNLTEDGLITEPIELGWWTPYIQWRGHVHAETPSWYDLECQRMWKEYGPAKFAGLELWGVPNGSRTE